MTTQINQDNMTSATIALLSGPRITNLQITNSSYVVLDDTAVSTSGGYIKITGTTFVSGCQVYIGSTLATSVTFVNSTTINAQVGAASAGTYLVYVVNPDSGTAILINGLTYSGTPTWVTGSTLPQGQVNSAISIQLSATGDTPLVYSLQAGSSLPSGVTLTSGGLLSGTVTGITSETTYNFTIEVTDPELQESPRAFSITITALDQYFPYVNLLLSANTPSSTFVTDASTNAFNITVNGDTRPNNFGPYTPGYYSNYFDGTGDYLTIASSNEFIASGNGFTIEAWVYYTSITNFSFVVASTTGANNYNPYWFIGSTSGGNWRISWGDANAVDVGVAIGLNTWNHVAISMGSNGTGVFYVNGVSRATTTGKTLNGSATGVAIADGGGSLAGQYVVTGYISNVRYVKNSSVYTAAFTPPTSPLTAISGTSLLTCQSNRFIDTSTNNFAITVSGNTTINGFDPFVPASNTATFGSGYFDGTGDSLSAGTNTAFSVGTGNFTLEAWVYPTNFTNYRMVFDNRNNVNNNTGFFLGLTGNQSGTPGQWFLGKGAGVNVVTSSTALTLNQWQHIVAVRSSGTTTLYLNGVSVGSASDTQNYSDTNSLIGITIDNIGWLGYLSNLRLVKGTAVYTTTFTPPTAPLTAITNTSLLTLQSNQPTNNNMFVDNSTNNFLITRNGNTTQGAFSPYPGTWSNYFDGTGDWLTFTGATTGSGNFTTEAWVYLATLRDYQVIFDNRATGASATGYAFGVDAAGKPYMFTNNGFRILSSIVITANSWNHLALVRNTTTVTLYVNGVSGGTYTSSANFSDTNNGVGVAPTFTSTSQYFGYISNLRIVNGTAVYTSAFTTPTQPLIAISGTTLLTCADNRIIDDSNNNFTLTRSGDVSVQKFSPFTVQTQIVPTSYSVYFDGTGDYLTIPTNTAFQLGTDDFTIECWVYKSSAANGPIIDARGSAAAVPYAFYVDASNFPYFYDGTSYTSTVAILNNQWNHIAVVRTSSVLKIFVNGVQGYSASHSVALNPSATVYIGGQNFATSAYTTGYISNLRIVKGTAVYTANFTPSTTPLTAIANTSLLTCQSTTIIDNSSNAFTITVNGNSRPLTQNPFGYTNPTQGPYTVSALGGSMYFDGAGDTLTIASSTINQFGSGNFTIETWYYSSGSISTAGQHLFFRRTTATAIGLIFQVDSSRLNLLAGDSNTGGWEVNISSTTTLVAGTWYHFAMSRSGSTWRIFVNGALENTATASFTIAEESANITIGTSITGYLSNYRIVKGQALYTSPFVPPAAPVTSVQNTVLLLNGTSAGVTDSSMIANYETVGGATVTTSTEYYGSNSVFFNGTNSGLFSASSVQHSFGSGNFTIEFWYYPTSTAGTNPNIMCNNNAGSFVSGLWSLHAPHSSYPNKYSLWVASFNTGAALLVSTTNIATNTWTFVTITRTTNTWRMFINGTIEATATHSGVLDNGGSYPQFIGYQPGVESGRYITGYMCDIRFTKGVSRYAANFTPPTTPFIQY